MSNSNFNRQIDIIAIGTLICWMLKGFNGKYSAHLADKYERRNLTVGCLF